MSRPIIMLIYFATKGVLLKFDFFFSDTIGTVCYVRFFFFWVVLILTSDWMLLWFEPISWPHLNRPNVTMTPLQSACVISRENAYDRYWFVRLCPNAFSLFSIESVHFCRAFTMTLKAKQISRRLMSHLLGGD